jgi:hypothetical protein
MNTGPPILRKLAEKEGRPCMCIDAVVRVLEAGHASLRAVDRCGQEGKTGGLPTTPRSKMCCILYHSGSVCGRIETHNHII